MNCPQCDKSLTHVGDFWVCPDDGIVQPDSTPVEPADSKKARLFLSYGRRDAADLANRLRGDLEARGYEVWQDTRRIRSGREWEQEIQDGLRSTQIVVALLSPHAVRVAHDPANLDNLDSVCLDEISFARFAQPPKRIIPIMARTCQPPFCIFRLDYVDLCAWKESEDRYQKGLARLLESVEAGLRGEAPKYRSWDDRLKPWDFAAFLNEKRRHFCGRVWLFDAIDGWRASSQERVLLITGDPGVGKSAIVAELVHRNPGGQVIAYHCCQADTQETLQPGRFVRSLAAMIASELPDYADKLSEPAIEEALSEGKCAGDPSSAFEAGILAPLELLPAPPEGVRYLLVDALDEALLLKGVTIADVLATRLRRLPAWLRVVATTRKDSKVLQRLSGLRAQELNAHDPRNREDIDRYITRRVEEPNLAERLVASRRNAVEIRESLGKKADGNFLYVQQALESIEHDLHGFDRLEDLPAGLNGLYASFFQRHFPDEGSYGKPRRLLEVVLAAREPLTAKQLADATGFDLEYEFPHVLRPLATYLPQTEGRHVTYHKSFADWLTSGREENEYYASEKHGHRTLAEVCWNEYQQGIATMSPYAVRHLTAHLLATGRTSDARIFLEARIEAADPKHRPFLKLNSDQEELRNELQVVLNLQETRKRWHPRPAEHLKNLGPQEDYCEVYHFPCCGYSVVVGDSAPSQFRADGCEDLPSRMTHCPTCQGTGVCPRCTGSGREKAGLFGSSLGRGCRNCRGTGTCPTCGGNGKH